MVQLFAFRRLLRVASLHLVALALCSVAIIASAAPVSHGMLMRAIIGITPVVTRAGTSPIVIIGTSHADRAGSAE
jgi:peptidoglycan/LPS O-acetylase OafA/YrhL